MRVLTTLVWYSNENNNLIELMRADKREFICEFSHYRHDCVGGEKICGGSLVQRILNLVYTCHKNR